MLYQDMLRDNYMSTHLLSEYKDQMLVKYLYTICQQFLGPTTTKILSWEEGRQNAWIYMYYFNYFHEKAMGFQKSKEKTICN